MPGNYMVVLSVQDGACSAVYSMDIVISSSTAVVQLTDGAVRAYAEAEGFVFQWSLANTNGFQVDILDAHGRSVLNREVNGALGTERFNMNGMAAGVYFLRVAIEGEARTFKLPLIR